METGYWVKGVRAKEGAYDSIDNIIKFALADSDYEEYEEWVEYTEEELAARLIQEQEMAKKMQQEEFLAEAEYRLSAAEECVAALTSAFREV